MLFEAFNALVESRRSIRAFRPDIIPAHTIEQIVSTAAHAPSNSNTQPWNVDVLTGEAKQSLTDAILAAHAEHGEVPSHHFPDPLPDEHRRRQLQFGSLFYGAYGIERDDSAAMMNQLVENYSFYGAPVGLIISIDDRLFCPSWLDTGIFLQTLLLSSQALGIGSCAQVVFAHYSSLIARHLRFPEHRTVVCGVSLGIPNAEAVINSVTYPRLAPEDFCTFHTSKPLAPDQEESGQF